MEKNPSEIKHVPLTSLPDVILRNIHKRLGRKEYLALRQTCKETKEWTESYYGSKINSHMVEQFKNVCFEIRYQNFDPDNNDRQQLENFVKANLKNITNFCLWNWYWDFFKIYKDPAFQELLTIFSPQIRKFRVLKYFNSTTEEEKDLFLSLTGLEELEIDLYYIDVNDDDDSERATRLLPFLKSLKSLKIDKIEFNIIGTKSGVNRNYWFHNLLEVCSKLEFLKMPLIDFDYEDYANCKNYTEEYDLVEKGLNTSLSQREPGSVSLETIDLNELQLQNGGFKEIEELSRLCDIHKINLVNSYWEYEAQNNFHKYNDWYSY